MYSVCRTCSVNVAARLGTIKLYPVLYQPIYSGRGLFYQDMYSVFVAKARTRRYSILKMEVGAVVRSKRCCQTSLGVARVALAELTFGEECDAHLPG